MEIKINSNDNSNYKNKTIKTLKDTGNSFSDILNNTLSTAKATDSKNEEFDLSKAKITTGNILIDNLPAKNKGDVLYAINKLDGIFNIDILGNPDKFINKDSTINILRILNIYGKDLTQSQLDEVTTHISTLYKNGLISDEDYFDALKWIQTKKEAFRIKIQNEKNKDTICDLILKPKKRNSKDKHLG